MQHINNTSAGEDQVHKEGDKGGGGSWWSTLWFIGLFDTVSVLLPSHSGGVLAVNKIGSRTQLFISTYLSFHGFPRYFMIFMRSARGDLTTHSYCTFTVVRSELLARCCGRSTESLDLSYFTLFYTVHCASADIQKSNYVAVHTLQFYWCL